MLVYTTGSYNQAMLNLSACCSILLAVLQQAIITDPLLSWSIRC